MFSSHLIFIGAGFIFTLFLGCQHAIKNTDVGLGQPQAFKPEKAQLDEAAICPKLRGAFLAEGQQQRQLGNVGVILRIEEYAKQWRGLAFGGMRTEKEVYEKVSKGVMSSLANSGIPAFLIYDENDPRLKEIGVLLYVTYREYTKKIQREYTTFDNALENQALWRGPSSYMIYKMQNPDYRIEIEGRCNFIIYNARKDDKVYSDSLEVAVSGLRSALVDIKPQWNISEALNNTKDPRALGPLLTALKDTDKDIRISAISALAENKDSVAVEHLIYSLDDQHLDVRRQAIRGLGRIKDPRAVESLIAFLKDKDVEARRDAVSALGEIKDQRTVEPLINALKDENWTVRYDAAIALGEFKDPRTVGPLVVLLNDDTRLVRETTEKTLKLIKDARGLEPFIASVRDNDPNVREGVIITLGKTKDPRAVDFLIAALKDEKWSVRCAAAKALGEIRDKKAVEPLTIALKDENENVRQTAKTTLSTIEAFEGIEPLVAGLKDKNPAVRKQTAVDLGIQLIKTKNDQIVESLIAALNDRDSGVRIVVAWAIGKAEDDRFVEPLIAALNDQDSGVRSAVAEALSDIAKICFRTNKEYGQWFITTKWLGQEPIKWQKWWEQNKGKCNK
jgi:HEAT repeat protein